MHDDRNEHAVPNQRVTTGTGQDSDERGRSSFESIRHSDEQGDYWLARELSYVEFSSSLQTPRH